MLVAVAGFAMTTHQARRDLTVVSSEPEGSGLHALYLGACMRAAVASLFSGGQRRVGIVANLDELDAALPTHPWDVVLVDAHTAPPSGIQACEVLRTRFGTLGIVLVNCDGTSGHVVAALEAGADDCIGENACRLEALARIRAVIRRSSAAAACRPGNAVFRSGPLEVDVVERQVRLDRLAVDVTPNQLRLLLRLLEKPGDVVFPRDLFPGTTPKTQCYESARLRVLVHDLRKRLGKHKAIVQGTPAKGYYLHVGGRNPSANTTGDVR
jgi:DNA-binding response OmpR family regulator